MLLCCQQLNADKNISQIIVGTYGEYSVSSTNDTYFDKQWYLSAINIYDAWSITMGNSNIVVAVLDSGVDWLHEDLGKGIEDYQNIFINPNEDIWTNENNPNTGNGIDDDNNGLIDDMKGWNFVKNNNDCRTNNYHGTFVSGIIAAKSNNNIGIAGIAGGNNNAGIKVLPYCVGTDSPESSILDDAIIQAVDNGARIIQLSLSVLHTSAVDAAIEYAEDKGVLIVCSSGNNYKNRISYPACHEYVLSVGAIGQNMKRASFSDYGQKLSVVAPGVDIYSTTLQNNYSFGNGTSFSAPQVSGVAGLVLSVNPELTAQQVRDIIESTAQKVRPDLYTYSNDGVHNNGTWNNEMGYGLVDAYAAVKKAQEYKYSDLYVRDVVGDNGTEPSVTHGIMWDSPDIWIEDMNGNKINNPYGNAEYKVCVRVHNRSEVSSTGEERLFLNWAKAGIDLVWRDNWTSDNIFDCGAVKGGVIGSANGVKIPVIAANGSEVVKVTWLTPMSEDYENCTDAGAENWHFCLTARVHDGEEIEGENENLLNMGVFTERNNNVAWKNISILNSKFPRAVVSVSNPYKEKHNFSIKYKYTANQSNEFLQDFADVYITLSEGLLKAWQEGGQHSQGVKRASENKFLITDNEVVFDNLVLEPKELHTIATEVNFYTQRDSKTNRFDFDIIEYCNDCENRIIGGEHYTAIKDGAKDFKAIAIEDKTVIKGREVSFTTNIINEQAEYVWYNQQGDTLTKGQTLTTRPINSQRYILEVTAKEDGYRDKDTVSVNVKRARINTLTPNPANTTCTITYELSEEINNARIVILNTLGNVVYSEVLPNGQAQTTQTINLQNITSGQYTLQIISQNETLDTKTLIIEQ